MILIIHFEKTTNLGMTIPPPLPFPLPKKRFKIGSAYRHLSLFVLESIWGHSKSTFAQDSPVLTLTSSLFTLVRF